jgi:hypothetical protein
MCVRSFYSIEKQLFVRKIQWRWNMVLSIWSQKQTTKFAMKTAYILTTQEIWHVEITNEDSAHHVHRCQGYCSLWIHSTSPNSQPSLLCGNTEAVTWNCALKRAWKLAQHWILHHNKASAHSALSVKEYLEKTTEMEHPSYSPDLAPNDLWLFSKMTSAFKGRRFEDTADSPPPHQKKKWQRHETHFTTGVLKTFPTVASSLG